MAQISAKISDANAERLREYTVKVKKSLKMQSTVIDEALTEFFKNKEEQGNCDAPCPA